MAPEKLTASTPPARQRSPPAARARAPTNWAPRTRPACAARLWTSNLAARARILTDNPERAGAIEKSLQNLLDDAQLSSVRDAKALDTLPREEREAWLKLWSDVRDLMARAGKK